MGFTRRAFYAARGELFSLAEMLLGVWSSVEFAYG